MEKTTPEQLRMIADAISARNEALSERDAAKAQVQRLTGELAFVRNEAAGFNTTFSYALERVEAERDALRDAPAPTCRVCVVPVLDDAEVACTDCLDTLTAERDAALQRAEAAEYASMRGQPRITTRCPSCGSQTLFIGAGGHLTCSLIGCKQPGVAGAIEAFRQEASAAQARYETADADACEAKLQQATWRKMCDESYAAEMKNKATIASLKAALARLQQEWEGLQAWKGLSAAAYSLRTEQMQAAVARAEQAEASLRQWEQAHAAQALLREPDDAGA